MATKFKGLPGWPIQSDWTGTSRHLNSNQFWPSEQTCLDSSGKMSPSYYFDTWSREFIVPVWEQMGGNPRVDVSRPPRWWRFRGTDVCYVISRKTNTHTDIIEAAKYGCTSPFIQNFSPVFLVEVFCLCIFEIMNFIAGLGLWRICVLSLLEHKHAYNCLGWVVLHKKCIPLACRSYKDFTVCFN